MKPEDDPQLEQAPGIRTGASRLPDAGPAVVELAQALRQPATGLVLVFASSHYDEEATASGLREAFGATPLIGCTTAGEIGPHGYQENGLTGASFGGDDMDFEAGLLENLQGTDQKSASGFAQSLRERLMSRHPGLGAERFFAFMLVDGLCGCEERVAHAFHDGLTGIPLAGGSSGGDLAFNDTRVLFNGRFFRNAAVLLVATTPRPISVFSTQHFLPMDTRMVVTGAIPERRIVTEINGFPAAEEYARVVGIDYQDLLPQVFAAHPVVVRIGDSDFVRSIQKVNPDGTLTFFCAIDRGIVFKVAQGGDMLANLDGTLAAISQSIGPPVLILACDCILRRLECRQTAMTAAVGARLAAAGVIGFSSFGEQWNGMHINQTFTGIALGRSPAP